MKEKMIQGKRSVKEAFALHGRVAIITGGAGLLGVKHAEAIAEMGGIPLLIDINEKRAQERAKNIASRFGVEAKAYYCDITNEKAVKELLSSVLKEFKKVDILINNAANNPKVEGGAARLQSRLENFSLHTWNKDMNVGLTGAFLCSKIIGVQMAKQGKGIILNIASDLALIAPDQRIYREPGQKEEEQSTKPISYSVVKSGLLGMTRYLAAYWAKNGVRVNAISPGGVYNDQSEGFVKRLTNLIPLGRMADKDEYKAAIVFLVSDASSYMTGANLVIDGGKTCW